MGALPVKIAVRCAAARRVLRSGSTDADAVGDKPVIHALRQPPGSLQISRLSTPARPLDNAVTLGPPRVEVPLAVGAPSAFVGLCVARGVVKNDKVVPTVLSAVRATARWRP